NIGNLTDVYTEVLNRLKQVQN
ncbi:hypothetical protein ACHI3A_11445, partial [Listeria monocytogenes]